MEGHIEELVLHFVITMPFVQAFYTFIFFLIRRKDLFDFLERFYLLETEFVIPSGPIRKQRLVAYLTIGLAITLTITGACFVTLNPSKVENGTIEYYPYYLTYYATFRDIFTEPILEMFQIWSFFCLAIPYLLSDLVPSFIYYHSGAIVNAICEDIQKTLLVISSGIGLSSETQVDDSLDSDGREIHRIWMKYDRLALLVRNTNQTFGPMVFFDYGIKFFLVSLLAHSVLATLRESNETVFNIVHLAMAICIAARLISGILLKSNLYRSSKNLSNQISTMTIHHWFCINKSQRKLLIMIQQDVERDKLIANPLDLFYISPGILLAMLSLTVTYIIILFQT